MDSLFTTIIFASVLVTLALLGLAIGWLITGKCKIGSCGKKCNNDCSCDHDKHV